MKPGFVSPSEARSDTVPDTDLEALFGEAEEIPCSEANHPTDKFMHDDGPATMYLQIWHQCIYHVGSVMPVCSKLAKFFIVFATEKISCVKCGYTGQGWEFATVRGPIGKF